MVEIFRKKNTTAIENDLLNLDDSFPIKTPTIVTPKSAKSEFLKTCFFQMKKLMKKRRT